MSKQFCFYQVEQACSALTSLAADVSVAMQLMKSDIMQPIGIVLKSVGPEELISVLQVVASLAFASDSVAQKMLTKDLVKSLKVLCAHKNPEASPLTSDYPSNALFLWLACITHSCIKCRFIFH